MSKSQDRLEHALLSTGMMNERFVQMIRDGEVDQEYVQAALQNFTNAMHPKPIPVKHRYVLGFLFSEDFSRVLLVKKNRPAWQDGLLNGVGGKIEAGETPPQAMEREFVEETFYLGFNDESGELQRPLWHYVGRRHRPATHENDDRSYEMFIYASTVPDCRLAEFWLDEPMGNEAVFQFPDEVDPNHEEIMSILVGTDLARLGVPGLTWVVDSARCALRENFHIEVEDPPMYPEDSE